MSDVLKAVFDFVIARASPAPDPKTVFQGYRSASVLPKDNDYTLITLSALSRRGTNYNQLAVDAEGNTCETFLQEYVVNVDFCHYDQDISLRRANSLALLGRGAAAVDFFAARGFGFLFADDTLYLPFEGDDRQFVQRLRVALHLDRQEGVTLPADYFTRAKIQGIKNIDVAFPPD